MSQQKSKAQKPRHPPALAGNPAKKLRDLGPKVTDQAPIMSDAPGTKALSESFASAPAAIFRPKPELINQASINIPYPLKAKQLMVEGIVRLKLTVSKTGQVIDAEILSGPHFGLRAAALAVSNKLLFLPATDGDGEAVIAQIEHEVVFRLNRGS